MFQAVLKSVLSMNETTHNRPSTYIKNTQVKQQKDYEHRHQSVHSQLNINDKVLLKNQMHQDRKGRKFKNNWLGPYTVANITKTDCKTDT